MLRVGMFIGLLWGDRWAGLPTGGPVGCVAAVARVPGHSGPPNAGNRLVGTADGGGPPVAYPFPVRVVVRPLRVVQNTAAVAGRSAIRGVNHH